MSSSWKCKQCSLINNIKLSSCIACFAKRFNLSPKLPKWIQINGPKDFNKWGEYPRKLIKINNCDYVMFLKVNGIYKYNVDDDSKSQFIECPIYNYDTFIFDQNHDIIYFIDVYGNEVLEFNVTTNKSKYSTTNSIIGMRSTGISSMILNDEIHIIGSSKYKHCVWNIKTDKITNIDSFKNINIGHIYRCHRLIQIPSRNLILLLGGYQIPPGEATNKVYSYSSASNEWKQLTLTLPIAIFSFAYVVTSDDKYIIIFGGWRSAVCSVSGDIFVLNLDIKPWRFVKSTIKCPSTDQPSYSAVNYHSAETSKLLINGYIKQHLLLFNLDLPQEIIDLIESWYQTEYILIMDNRPYNLWTIPLNDILSSINYNKKEDILIQSKFSGICIMFNAKRGFGFIAMDNGSDNIFVHATSIHSENSKILYVGERVEFNIVEQNNGRKMAIDVTGINGAYVRGYSSYSSTSHQYPGYRTRY